jgi:hypothetical protein
MAGQLHQTRASAEALEFVGRNALMALPLAAVAAVCLYRGPELRTLGSQILVFGACGLLGMLAAALAVTRQRLTLALGPRTYTRWRRVGRQAGLEQGSLDEVAGVTIDVRADYDTDGGTPIPSWVVLLEFKDPPRRCRSPATPPRVQVWWVAPLAFVALGGLGLVATVLGVGARFEIRETATSLVFIKRLFGRPWRATEMPKPAIIVIEHRLDPFRVRGGRHELLVRALGQVVRLPEGGPSNADLVWLEEALLAMRYPGRGGGPGRVARPSTQRQVLCGI